MQRPPSGRPGRSRLSVFMRPEVFLFAALVALVFLLALASTGRAAVLDPPYPRVGLYGVVLGTGYPYVDADGNIIPTEISNTARYPVAVLHASPLTEYRSDVLQAIRAENPSIHLYAYLQAHYIWPNSSPDSLVHIWTRIHHLVRNNDGFLYGRDGEWILDVNINLAKKDGSGRFIIAEGLADLFHDAVWATGKWEGLFFDRMCQNIRYIQGPGDSIDFVRAGYPTFDAFEIGWKAGSDTLANRLRRRCGPNAVLIGNCGYGAHYESFNGWMREDFPLLNGNSWTNNMYRVPGGYFHDEANFQAPRQNWISTWTINQATPFSAEEARRVRFGLASAALGEGFASFCTRHYDPAINYMDWWYDEYGVNVMTGQSASTLGRTGWLGRGLAPYTKVIWAGTNADAVTNPGFETNVTSGWTFGSVIGSTIERDVSTKAVGTASARIRCPVGGGTSATSMTTINSIPYSNSIPYAVTFYAKAAVPRTVQFAVVNGTPGPGLAWSTISLDTVWRRYQIQFTGVGFGPGALQIRFGAMAGDVWLDDVHFQSGTQHLYRRDFENGIILLNPSLEILTTSLERPFRRILGVVDPVHNNGTTAATFTLRPSDAIFLLKFEQEIKVDVPGIPRVQPGITWGAAGPNPFRDQVRFSFTLEPEDGSAPADLAVFDVAGRRVRQLYRGQLEPGTHAFDWDGMDAGGRRVAPGVYFVRARQGTLSASRKLFRVE